MKIVYLSNPSFADADFPLVHELQREGHQVDYFMFLAPYNKRATIIDIKHIKKIAKIFSAKLYPELNVFHEYLDFDHFYVVNQTHKSQFYPSSIKLQMELWLKIKKLNPDRIIITSAFSIPQLPFYYFRTKTLFVVHDPFPHTGESGTRRTFLRNVCFRLGRMFMLLNKEQVNEFSTKYNVDIKRIRVAKLGLYTALRVFINNKKNSLGRNQNVLFFGRISQYKGVEYLCKAMKIVQKKLPHATLTIAGGGKLYFDYTPYKNLSYIKLINRFVPIEELANLLDSCDVVVCPYTDATQSGVIMTSYVFNKPVIATKVGGLVEMMDNGKTGLLAEPRNPQDIADNIIQLLTDKGLYDKMVENIKHKYSEGEWSWRNIAQKYLQ